MEDKLLEVQDLKMHFPVRTSLFKSTPLKAVDGVSFSIGKGKTLGLVGESGCGKSTVGRTILQLYKPTGGQVLFKGRSPQQDLQQFRRQTAMVFQDPYSSLDPRMSVLDLIAEPLDIHRLCKSSAERRDRVLELMEQVGLNRRLLTRFPHEFSGGQRQRIGIARALATNPEFIVCDEPVSALDVSIQAQVINMFRSFQEQLGLTYLFIAHDLPVVRHVSDRIAVMYLGRLMEVGEAQEVYHRPMHPYTQSLMAAVPPMDPGRARSMPKVALGEIPSPLNTPTGCPFRTRCPYATEICGHKMPPLAEVATGHYTACHHIDRAN